MKFFIQLHRSIFEPRFYHEVLELPRRAVLRYCIWLLLLFGVITSIAYTVYLIGGRQGIPEGLAAAFPGMELRDGILHPPVDTPYYPPSYLIAPLFNQLVELPVLFNSEADSTVLVDTAARSVAPRKVPLVHLKAKTVEMILGDEMTMEFPYEYFLFGTRDLIFTADHIRSFLLQHVGGIFFGYLLSTLIHQFALILFSIFFLSAAAYIFRIDRKRTFREYIKIAGFAVSPIAVGNALVAVSGVKVPWIWNILIFLSTMVMFRAILTISITSRDLQGPRNNASDGT
ncbi:MAG: DUF1189 family protein [Chitinispirillaceae bacterium]|nr:DUF1189 family protein [Chitinispirillaceae bacterium]